MSDRDGPALRFELLGPLRAWRGEVELGLGSLQQRVVLTVLLLQANRPLGREQLVDAVWGAEAPVYAVNLLQKHVSGLRRILEPVRPSRAPSRVLAWTEAGYLLSVPPDRLDLWLFDRELDRARVARAAGDLHGAADALHAALRLWRGLAWEGLASPLLDLERDRLAERRTSAVEERIEVDLALGGHLDLIAELRRLVAEHPLRERLHCLLMLALHRSGRQAAALAAFQDARRYLRNELGIEPSAQLQQLHQQILTADEILMASPSPAEELARSGPNSGHRLPVPAQLPHGIPDFTGRDAEIKQLHNLLNADSRAVVISAIAGTAGVGKTALAVQWAHDVRDRFPDGQLYVNLRGFDPTGSAMDPAEAIRGFLDTFGVPPERIPLSLETQAALYRSLLSDKRVLVILDNAEGADQVRPLLPGAPGCLVLVTSRNQLTGLIAEGAQVLLVDLLSIAEARQLLARRLGQDRVAAEPEAVDEIIALCARLPLALTIVAARAATHPQFPLAVLAAELREARGGLNAFDGMDQATDARGVFSWSYQRLSDAARLLFRLLGLHPGPDIATPAAASLMGVPLAQIRPVLTELIRAHLVTERIPGRFSFHDLLRAYATELTHTLDTENERRAAVHRMLEHYLHTVHAADRLLNPTRDPLTLDLPQPGVNPENLADSGKALAWLIAEYPVLLAAIDLAATTRIDALTGQLVWALGTFLDRGAHWHDQVTTQRAALEASRRLADRHGQADAHRGLARAYTWLSRYGDAHAHYRQALDLYEELGDEIGQAHAHRNLAWVLERQDRHPEALGHAQRALGLFRAAGHVAGQADALNAVGWFHAKLGDAQQALACCQEAITLHQEIGHREGEAHTWDSLGYTHHNLGHHHQAITCYQYAINLWRDLGDRYYEAATLTRLGDTHYATVNPDLARKAWQQAQIILDELSHPDVDLVRAKLANSTGTLSSPS